MKYVISGILGILIGIGTMLLVNLLPEPYSNKDMIMLENIYIPTLKMVSNDIKLISNEVKDKEIYLKYDSNSIKKETVLEYYKLLKNYGYKNLKNDFEQEENGEMIEVFATGEDKLLYVTCVKNPDIVSIKYSLEQGNIEIFENEKYFIYDKRNQYYDMQVDEKIVKIPSLNNVVDLVIDSKRVYKSNNYMSIRHNYEEHTTSEQKEAYLSKYGEFLLENGFLQGKDKREFYNDIVKISISNDFYFEITANKKYN